MARALHETGTARAYFSTERGHIVENSAAGRRWMIPVLGAVIQILTGIPAAWGAFREPLMQDYGLQEEGVGLAFVFLVAAYGLGCLLGGFLQDAKGPRTAGLCGTALLSGAFLGAAFLPGGRPQSFWLLFSLPAGLGSAFLYPAVMSCAQKWFAARKGFVTGLIGGAVGLSGGFLTLWVRVVGGRWGMRVCLGALGGLMLVVCTAASCLLVNPPPPPQKPELQGKKQKQPPLDIPPRQMLQTPQFWLGFGMVLLAAPTMLLFSPVIVKLGQERGLSESAAHWSIVIGSLGSAAGRVLCPMRSDSAGRRRVCMALFAALAGLSAWLAFAPGWQLILCYTGLTFCYSGLAAVIPALSSDLFGLPHAGINYGFMALGMTGGSLGSWLLNRNLGQGAYRHWIAVTAALLGGLCAKMLHPVKETGSKLG